MRGDGLSIVCALAAAGAIALAQLPGRAQHARLKEGTDAYLLPPPTQLVSMSLGHRAALADVLWADLQVTQGLRLFEKRRYDLVVEYLDAINELDPTWRDPYRLADTFITLQAKAASIEQIREARRILERGVRERPNDAELWFVLGAFVTFIAPNSYMEENSEEYTAWKRDGALYLARAAELAPADANITWQTLAGARILAETGQVERSTEMLRTILATTDDPELRADVELRLARLAKQKADTVDSAAEERRRDRDKHFRELARRYLLLDDPRLRRPGSNLETTLLLGPPRDSARCAGPTRDEACVSNWREWAAREQASALGR